MQRCHIDAGLQQQGMFVVTVVPAGPDVLGGCGDDVDEKTLMFLVVVGKEAADRIDLFMLVFQQRAEIGFTPALFGSSIHIGFGF